jgi:uroporphyrinogen decarboxylase
MLKAMRNEIPDRVPVAPDISNMIPCRMTGKPFWEIFLYQDPPLWHAYIDVAKYFGIDGWLCNLDGFWIPDPDAPPSDPDIQYEKVIIERNYDRIITREYTKRKGEKIEWSPLLTIYPRYDPPTTLLAEKIDMAEPPEQWEKTENIKPQKYGFDLMREALEKFDDCGVLGVVVSPPQLGMTDSGKGYSIYDYSDSYDEVINSCHNQHKQAISYLKRILSGPVKPDFILTGGSGMLVFNTPDILREISLPTLQEITRLCKEAGIPSQIHCCGPERELIEICANETDLSSINPLEIPPMGNCELAEIKNSFGGKLGLMGNLHTTDIMLYGSVTDVRRESLKAIRDAGENGGFILSTGDQCGRDTPDENIFEMVNVVKEFGNYPLNMKSIQNEINRLEKYYEFRCSILPGSIS